MYPPLPTATILNGRAHASRLLNLLTSDAMQTAKQSVFLRIQVRASSQTFTDFFTDFEKKPTVLQSRRNDLTGSFFKIPFCSQDCYNVQMNIEHCYRQNSSFMPY